MKQLTLMLLLILVIVSCTKNDKDIFDKKKVEKEILALGNEVVMALNTTDIAMLTRDFWQSDSTIFMIDGIKVQGYDNICEALKGIRKRRKSLKLTVDHEQVITLDNDTGIHVVEFHQQVIHLNDSISNGQGIWSTF